VQYGEPRALPTNLLSGIKGELTRRVKKGMVEIGRWNDEGRRRDERGKGRGSVSTTPDVPSNFSAAVAPMKQGVLWYITSGTSVRKSLTCNIVPAAFYRR